MKNIYHSFLCVGFFVLYSCSSKPYNSDEADRSMKILNSNLVNLATAGSEKKEFRALEFLFQTPGVPLPFAKSSNLSNDTSIFRMATKKGIYEWNSALQRFVKQSESEQVALIFLLDSMKNDNIRFELDGYQTQAYSSQPDLPISGKIKIFNNEQPIFSVQHTASITNNLPETIKTIAKGSDYSMEFILNRTQSGKSGELAIDFSLGQNGFDAISAKARATIEYSRQSYFYKIIEFKIKLIDHHVVGKINYSAIDPTSADYISSFNSNSSILLFEGTHQVGSIVLNKTQNGELLDYFIRFSDGKEILLSYYIPLLNKLLNLKY
jgi:hypothetical protein